MNKAYLLQNLKSNQGYVTYLTDILYMHTDMTF